LKSPEISISPSTHIAAFSLLEGVMKGNWEFDFAVLTPSPVVTVIPGGSASVPINVEMRGQPQLVQLNVASNWGGAGIVAQVSPNIVAVGGGAMLHVVVSANTPPGSYIFGIQGTTQGTFKTSEALVTVVVTPNPAKQDQQPKNTDGDQSTPEDQIPVDHGRKMNARPAPGKMGPRPAARGPASFIMSLVVLGGLAFGLYMLNQQTHFIDTLLGSTPAATSDVSTYEGTQTFTIFSAMGGNPNSATGAASVQIDNAGDVLGPVLFGKVTNGVFTGQAQAQQGTFPMTGTVSGGVLHAEYKSSSVSWVWNLHKK
jgi:hypothetical protein